MTDPVSPKRIIAEALITHGHGKDEAQWERAKLVIEALNDAGYHLLGTPEQTVGFDGKSKNVRYDLKAIMDDKMLHATHVASAQDEMTPANRETVRAMLGVNFALELGKRLGVVPEELGKRRG